MIEKLNNNIQNFLPQISDKNQNRQTAQPAENADASLEVNYKSLIEKAVNSANNDREAVEKAKKMMLSGQLDSIENIREAAENIVGFGI